MRLFTWIELPSQNLDFNEFASVLERQHGRCLMLVYKSPPTAGEVEEVVLNLQGFLLEAILPPVRQCQ